LSSRGSRLSELERIRDSVVKPGSEAVEKQRRRGKLHVRERLGALLDPGSFQEIGWMARSRLMPQAPHGDGVVAGFGRIGGRPVYVFAEDFTVMGGSIGEVHGEKIARVIELAVRVGVPVVGLWDSGGARIQEGVAALHGVGRILSSIVHASGVIPQVSLVLGPSAGGAAYATALMDFTIVVDNVTYMFITGPDVVYEATGERVGFEELGGARVHASRSGVASFRAASEEEAFALTRRLLSYLPDNYQAPLPVTRPPPTVSRDDPELDSLLPEDPSKPYDMMDILARILDPNSLLEVHREWAPSIITAFARLGGIPVCVVANQPLVAGGAIDVDASVKAARFIRFCDSFNLPILMVVDVPGYMPGVGQEHGGIIRHGAKMVHAYAEATTPKITLIVGKAYGGAYIAMGSRALGADIVYAWPTAEIAVLGPRPAVRILYKRRLAESPNPGEEARRLEEEYRRSMLNPYRAAELGLVDDVIPPRETRRKLYASLTTLLPKREQRIPRKHSNIPL